MLLSIVVPAYNVENYIEKCIDSIVTQQAIDYEVIVVNDGSTDNTLSIIRKLEEKYSNVVVIDQKNRGLGAARNTGIFNANGKYITFVDSDDYLIENTYGNLFKEVGDESFDIICYKLTKFYEGEIANFNNENIEKIILNNENAKKMYYSNKISSYVCDKVYNINLFKNNNIIFPEGKYYEDLKTSYELFLNAKKILKTNVNGYMYLQRRESITKNIKKKNLNDFTSEYLQVLDSMEKNNDINVIKEVDTYRVIKYNAIIRMKMKLDDSNYNIDERIKIKLSFKDLIRNKDLSKNEKLINFIGENKLIFKILKNINRILLLIGG